jgi:hypothetical protein
MFTISIIPFAEINSPGFSKWEKLILKLS